MTDRQLEALKLLEQQPRPVLSRTGYAPGHLSRTVANGLEKAGLAVKSRKEGVDLYIATITEKGREALACMTT